MWDSKNVEIDPARHHSPRPKEALGLGHASARCDRVTAGKRESAAAGRSFATRDWQNNLPEVIKVGKVAVDPHEPS